MSTPSIAPAGRKSNIPRNVALLCEILARGAYVLERHGNTAVIPSKSHPGVTYLVTHTSYQAIRELCTCPVHQGPTWQRPVIRWQDAAGQWQSNGTLPCSHILLDRFDRQWRALDADERRILIQQQPDLIPALARNPYYSL